MVRRGFVFLFGEKPEPGKARIVKDAHGNVLMDGDHEISCKTEGVSIGPKACFVKKA